MSHECSAPFIAQLSAKANSKQKRRYETMNKHCASQLQRNSLVGVVDLNEELNDLFRSGSENAKMSTNSHSPDCVASRPVQSVVSNDGAPPRVNLRKRRKRRTADDFLLQHKLNYKKALHHDHRLRNKTRRPTTKLVDAKRAKPNVSDQPPACLNSDAVSRPHLMRDELQTDSEYTSDDSTSLSDDSASQSQCDDNDNDSVDDHAQPNDDDTAIIGDPEHMEDVQADDSPRPKQKIPFPISR